MASSPSSQRPISRAIAAAVSLWSPVIMTARMPALRHVATASFTAARGGSIIPTRPRKVSSRSESSPIDDESGGISSASGG